jgi:hypothetical protein
MGGGAFGLRDVMLLLVALAAVYLVVMLFRLIQVGRQRAAVRAPEPAAEKPDTVSPLRRRSEPELESDALPVAPVAPAPRAAAAYAAVDEQDAPPEEPFAVPPAPTFDWEDVKELFGEPAEPPVPVQTPAAPPARRSGFGEHLADHLARSDMEMEVQRMRDEMERMRVEVEELRAARRVSPQYAEAMELAQRGLSAQDVADRLGISLAEAELVHALSRGRENFAEGENHGADEYAAGTGGVDEFGRRRTG